MTIGLFFLALALVFHVLVLAFSVIVRIIHFLFSEAINERRIRRRNRFRAECREAEVRTSWD